MAERGVADNAAARAEEVARVSYGRLLAVVAASTGDIRTAEDALADAFERALTTWPAAGIPERPEGWLVTVARNRIRDVARSAAWRTSAPLDTEIARPGGDADGDLDPDEIPDKRLALMFVCAHPAIDPGIRTALMLQTVLGFESKQIAAAFLVPEAAMAGRLVRAKRRIRDARIPFVVPNRDDMPARLPAVLEAIYGAYAIEWQRVSGETVRDSLASEALYLATTLASLLPDEPEALGLAALISLSLSRTSARTTAQGRMVPLDEQDTALWDAALIRSGETFLRRAHGLGRPGRFQLEAAIQSVHCARASSGTVDVAALRTLSEALVRVAPTLGARVALAAAVAGTDGPLAGLASLDAITDPAAVRFQPAWATRAHLLKRAGRGDDAAEAFDRAISLTADAPLRAYLVAQAADAAATQAADAAATQTAATTAAATTARAAEATEDAAGWQDRTVTPTRSSGVLLYRFGPDSTVQVWIAHMGGPFWAKKDAHAWSIPKGEYTEGEEPLDAALREFAEEIGTPAPALHYTNLGDFRQGSGKTVTAYAAEADFAVDRVVSNTFSMEWPPHSGRQRDFPEIDDAGWFSVGVAREKLVRGQLPLLDTLEDRLARGLRRGYSADQMRAAEASHLAAGEPLMRRAAAGLAAELRTALAGQPRVAGRTATVLLLVGPGNNGADTLYAGAELAAAGTTVVIVPTGSRMHEEAFAAALEAGAEQFTGTVPQVARRAAGADVIVDGILGTGTSPNPALRGRARAIVEAIRPLLEPAAGRPLVVAVDLPSGIGPDDGMVPDPAVLPADVTVTFGGYKAGLLLPPASALAGKIRLIHLVLDADLAAVKPLFERRDLSPE